MKTHIVIHHSLTKDSDTVSWGSIRKYHMKELGWAEIGYHWGLEQINGHLEVIQGRPTDFEGAHCKDYGMNQKGIGICCVGNFDLEVPSLELLKRLRELVQWLQRVYQIPTAQVIGHREAQELAGLAPEARKSCPGRLFNLETFRRSL